MPTCAADRQQQPQNGQFSLHMYDRPEAASVHDLRSKQNLCSTERTDSLLLATLITIGLLLASGHLAKHDNTVAIHEGNTREALAVLEAVANKGLLWLEAALSHLVALQGVRILHLLATGLLAHLPNDLGNSASGTTATHEADR